MAMSRKPESPATTPSVAVDLGWILRTAWRDSRGKRKALLLFVLCVVFGISALTAVRGFRANLEASMEAQARTLLGADLEISANQPFVPEVEDWIAALGGEQTREITFNSMAWFPEVEQSRLVRVRAMSGRFPFYGLFERDPVEAHWEEPREGGRPPVLAEEALLSQFGLARGSAIHLGGEVFTLRGAVLRMGGERAMAGIFAPRILVNLDHLEETGLLAYGSIRRHRVYFAWEDGLTEERRAALREARDKLFAEHSVRVRTVESEKRQLGRNLDNLYNFLNLTGFIALLLGGIGVAGSVHVYLSEKRASVALLRCLGAPIRAAFAVYLLQVAVVGLLGAVLGVLLGLGAQLLLPVVIAPLLPFTVEVAFAPESAFFSLGFGWLVASLFALTPLLPLRRVSPLAALRMEVEPIDTRRDPLVWATGVLIGLVALGFCLTQTTNWLHGLGFAAGLGTALGVLWGLAWCLRAGLRRVVRGGLPFSVRQGVANLYRPGNRTLFLIITMGMGAFLLHTLYLSRDLLLGELAMADRAGEPNLIFFDIQPDQREEVEELVRELGHNVIETAPIVTMRLRTINDQTMQERRRDGAESGNRWAYTREYRSSYRDTLTDAEVLLEGEFPAPWDGEEPVPVSIEEGLLETLSLSLGDRLLFDVQGVPIETVVASVREVDWSRIRTNFFFLFPGGVLEEAPMFFALVTRAENRESAAALQGGVVRAFPNVSAVDLALLLDTLDQIFTRVGFVIRFMAAFTIATGVMVLASAIWTSRSQRMRESALLRTLGASTRQLRAILVVEYTILGVLGASAGVALSFAAGFVIARFFFEISFQANLLPAGFVVVAAALLTVVSGLLFSRVGKV